MTDETPSYELFRARSRGWLTQLIVSLEPGIPHKIVREGRNSEVLRPQVYIAAKRQGIQVATRSIDGELWVCLLRPEDIKQGKETAK